MTRFFFFGAALALLLPGVSSCTLNQCGGNKERFLDKFDELVAEVSEADLPYSDSGWDDYDRRFRTLVEDCYPEYEADLRGRERRRFWSRFVKYYYKRYGAGLARELLDKRESELGDIQLDWQDFPTDELQDLLETVGDDVENWGQELDDWLQNWRE